MTEQEITYRSDVVVEAVDHMGGDRSIIRAMLVSTAKDKSADEMEDNAVQGRISALIRERHGTPFEHAAVSFYVEAPIFVFREWHRHRIGVSINEMSGRYSELPPQFYVPPPDRPLVKEEGSKQMDYKLVSASEAVRQAMIDEMQAAYRFSYLAYKGMLDSGIAKEVARMVLPVGTYSKMYWTCNPRSLMAFISLRTRREPYWEEVEVPLGSERRYRVNHEGAQFPSKPQWEIDVAAQITEDVLQALWPMTHKAFVNYGRVAP